MRLPVHTAERANLLHTGSQPSLFTWLPGSITGPAAFPTPSLLGKTGGLRWTTEQDDEERHSFRVEVSVYFVELGGRCFLGILTGKQECLKHGHTGLSALAPGQPLLGSAC